MHLNRFPAFVCAAFSLLTVASCQKASEPPPVLAVTCATPAIVRDLAGLDGCGLVLELKSGQRLEPIGKTWQGFHATAGQAVMIDYTPTSNVSTCMVGQVAEITCIRASSTILGTNPDGN